jgi:hypothetical protein
MNYQVQDFEREYAGMADDELLRLALAPQDLVQDARTALHAEMSRRGLHANHVAGLGFARFCKWNRSSDHGSPYEEFTTTVFFVFAWIPVFPIATYRVRRRKGFGKPAHVLQKLPMNWGQALWVWTVTLMLAFAVVVLVRFAPHLFR